MGQKNAVTWVIYLAPHRPHMAKGVPKCSREAELPAKVLDFPMQRVTEYFSEGGWSGKDSHALYPSYTSRAGEDSSAIGKRYCAEYETLRLDQARVRGLVSLREI